MEEPPNDGSQEASQMDLSTSGIKEVCGGEDDELSLVDGGSRGRSGVSMPIYFLIKEHSKSVIHIQELQKRLSRVENVQDDVVDAIIEFRNYLSDSKSYNSLSPMVGVSSLSVSRNPDTIFSKLTPSSTTTNTDVPSAVDVPHSILRTKSYFSKDCDPTYSEYARSPTLANKHFDLAKCKESSALESDKQDSGLDSDCRESLQNKNGSHLITENNDELLQLLDEVSHRSVILQKQLAVVEESPALVDQEVNQAAHKLQSDLAESKCPQPKFTFHEASSNESPRFRDQKSKSFSATTQSHPAPNSRFFANSALSHTLHQDLNASTLTKQNSRFVGLFDSKPVGDLGNKRSINGIDSNVVSSILKETNPIELQRQALIYLVDNAMLHAKLQEAENTISSRASEGDKVENTLKEEARILMMENRELRISLEEQKLENNAIKSRLAMLERVVQSVTNENHELNWQLGESLNLQTKNGSRHFSSSLQGSSSSVNKSKRPEASINCVRSKLLSNNSSFLDVTVEEPAELVAPAGSAVLKSRNGPIHSSTPMPFQRFRSNLNSSSIPGEADKFLSAKKCPKTDDLRRSCLDDAYDIPKVKQLAEGSFSQDSAAAKFPFNSILEKLKSNSECRLSRSASTKAEDSAASKSTVNLLKNENVSQCTESKTSSSQVNSSDIALQRRKGRNIQQRIQSILDRIVAESDDAS